jgi:CRISPR-associated protein Csd1
MILQRLHALYGRLADDETYDLAQPGFSPQKISFKVVINDNGSLFGIQDARQPNDKGKLVPSRMRVPGEAKPSGAGINPCFLWDNQTYLLGRNPEGRPADFGLKRFEAFREHHLSKEKELSHDDFSKVCRFLEQWTPEQLSEFPLLNDLGTGFGVFQILGNPKFVHDDSLLREWWKKNQPVEDNAVEGQCLLTGDVSAIARLHPKIKGVKDAQSAGASLVSYNETAYESYGKTQSYNGPVSEDAAFRYGTALNALLNGPRSSKHRLRIGDTTCVFWTDKESIVEDIFASIAQDGSHAIEKAQDESVRAKIESFLKALSHGREAYAELDGNPDTTRFYILGLAPNAARLSVRFFYQSSLGELLDNLRTHKNAISIVRQFETEVGRRRADSEFPAYWEFLRETVRQGDDPPPLLGGALMRAILEATPYPESLLTSVIRRVHLDRDINYLRAAAIKAVLIRNHQLTIATMLDTDNTNGGYLLGRLFAVLEKVQEEGHREQTGRNLDKTIRETYFSAACATPASVFPRLEQLSTHHRRHLNPGRKVQFDQLIGEIKWPQSGATKTHNLEEQGLFILGYYHQRKALFTKNTEAKTTESAA